MQGRIYVFGGWDTPVCFNDMFMLDLGKQFENVLLAFTLVSLSGKVYQVNILSSLMLTYIYCICAKLFWV